MSCPNNLHSLLQEVFLIFFSFKLLKNVDSVFLIPWYCSCSSWCLDNYILCGYDRYSSPLEIYKATLVLISKRSECSMLLYAIKTCMFMSVVGWCFAEQKIMRQQLCYPHCPPLTCYLEKQLDSWHLISTHPTSFDYIIASLSVQVYLLSMLYL